MSENKKSLYLHIPFCRRKCPYCSFTVYAGRKISFADYSGCLSQEAKRYKGQKVETVYIGGGTPTQVDCNGLKQIIKMIENNFVFAKNAEWTIEANPENISDDKLDIIRQSGINRVSLGIQSFDDSRLKYLGRTHNAKTARAAFAKIRQHGFSNINVDLMFGFPGQKKTELEAQLDNFIELESEHVSVYALTVEEKSIFFRDGVNAKNFSDEQAEFYCLVKEKLEKAGYKQYEVSNFSRSGRESKHNINYWRCGEYIGLGVGAHSHLDGSRFSNTDNIFSYLELIKTKKSAVAFKEKLPAEKKLKEAFLFGLRMNEGVSLASLEKKYNVQLKAFDKERISLYIKEGLLEKSQGKIKTTLRGMLVLDEICANLI